MSKIYGNSLENILGSLDEGYQLIGLDWKYIFVNDTVVKQSKYTSKNDLLGYTMMEKYPGIENTKLFEVISQCMKTKERVTMVNEFKFPDNSLGWFELSIQGSDIGVFIHSRDITDRKLEEIKRKKHIKFLEKILFMVAHNLRHPVTNLLGIIGLIKSDKTSLKEMKEIAQYIEPEVEKLNKFSHELTEAIEANQTWHSNEN